MTVHALPERVEFDQSRHVCDVTGKTRFGSRHAATKSRHAGRNKGARMRPYLCEHCHGWHLTTQVS